MAPEEVMSPEGMRFRSRHRLRPDRTITRPLYPSKADDSGPAKESNDSRTAD